MSEEMMERLLPEGIGPAIHVEKQALRETQSALQARVSSAAIALAASALVFACLPPEHSYLVDALRKGGVWLAAGLCAISLGFWWRFIQACARLRGSGLRSRGHRPRTAWGLGGAVASMAVVGTVLAAFGIQFPNVVLCGMPGFVLATWLGERMKQIPDVDTAQEHERKRLSLRQSDEDE